MFEAIADLVAALVEAIQDFVEFLSDALGAPSEGGVAITLVLVALLFALLFWGCQGLVEQRAEERRERALEYLIQKVSE